MYIDYLILCLDDVEIATTVGKVATNIFGRASMSFTKWVASIVNVLHSIPPDLRAPVEELFLNEIQETSNPISKSLKVIGMRYSPKQDNFNFQHFNNI